MDDSPVTETKEAENVLEFMDLEHGNGMMEQLSHLHSCGRFCDATLVVGEHEIGIHRAVLASASSLFYDIFFRAEEDGRNQTVFKVKDVDWVSFDLVLKFIYTGKLSVPESQIPPVYKVAHRLRLDSASNACAQHLIASLTPDNCLGVRLFAADECFRQQVDTYILDNIAEVTNTKHFFTLPRVAVEIVVADDEVVTNTDNSQMLPLVMNWVKGHMSSAKDTLDRMTEDVNVLYLNKDNTLTDCMEVETTDLKENDVVQDYKKLTKKKQSGKVTPRESQSLTEQTNGAHPFRKFNLNPEIPTQEVEWSIIASHPMKDRTYMAIVVIKGTLASISIHYRPAVDTTSSGPDSPVHGGPLDRYSSLVPLEPMQMKRCAFGLKMLNNKLFACGGYDRGECMKSTEQYSFEENVWTSLAEMKSPRGRFSISEYEGKIYACGGSDGHKEIKTVEVYDSVEDKWSYETDCPGAKASPGIIIQDDKLYIIGGSMGQKTVTHCDAYNLKDKTWASVAKLNMPRYQVPVCSFEGQIWAIGGTNGWKCLTDTEVYDAETDTWSPGPPLNIPRRGPGVAVYDGTIYVVGGNDGTSALNSTEIYDKKTGSWVLGPILSMPRANCGVTVLENKLFAVGGYNGKKFLDTLEYLDKARSDEWCSYLPVEYDRKSSQNEAVIFLANNVTHGDEQLKVSNGHQTAASEKDKFDFKIESSTKTNDLISVKPLKAESKAISCNGGINGHDAGDRNS